MGKIEMDAEISIDKGMVLSLRAAGWSDETIAREMGVETEKVEAVKEEVQNADHAGNGKKKQEEPAKFVILDTKELKEIYERAAEVGASEAIKKFETEKRKYIGQRSSRRLRNTKLLLRNYRMLKSHAESSVFSRDQIEDSAFEILEEMMQGKDDQLTIDSIEKSATRTAIMVSHVETMIGLYAAFCDKCYDQSLERRRYEVMHDMYISDSPLSAQEIAEKYSMSERSVYTDLKIAIERLSALLFGVDSLL